MLNVSKTSPKTIGDKAFSVVGPKTGNHTNDSHQNVMSWTYKYFNHLLSATMWHKSVLGNLLKSH